VPGLAQVVVSKQVQAGTAPAAPAAHAGVAPAVVPPGPPVRLTQGPVSLFVSSSSAGPVEPAAVGKPAPVPTRTDEPPELLARPAAEARFNATAQPDNGGTGLNLPPAAAPLPVNEAAPVEVPAGGETVILEVAPAAEPMAPDAELAEPEAAGPVAGLLAGDLSALEKGVQAFLTELDQIGRQLAEPDRGMQLAAWLALLATAGAGCELARRELRRRHRPDLVLAGGASARTLSWFPGLSDSCTEGE
jgi:hypothetical protein